MEFAFSTLGFSSTTVEVERSTWVSVVGKEPKIVIVAIMINTEKNIGLSE